MAGRHALPAAMLVVLAAGCSVTGLPCSANAQTVAQAGSAPIPAAGALNPLRQPGAIGAPGPLVTGAPGPAVSAIQNQRFEADLDYQQQGVAIPQRPANQGRNVGVQLSSRVLYDSNASRSSQQRAQSSGLSQSDVSFPLAVLLDIYLPSGANTFSLGGNVGYDFHLRNTQRNGENIGLRAGYNRLIQPCSIALGANYQRSRSQLNNNGLVIVPVKNIQSRSGGNLSVSCGSLGGIRPFASGSFSQGRNSDPLRKVSDNDTRTYGAGIAAGQPGFLEVGIVGSIDDTKYPNRGVLAVFRTTRFKAKSIGLYAERAAARRLTARLQLNYTAVSADRGPSFKGLSGQGDVSFIPGGRFVFRLSGSRATVPSLSTEADYQVVTIGAITVSAVVGPKTNVSLGFVNRHRRYLATVFDPLHPLTDDTLRSIDFGAQYRAAPKLNLDASVAYDSRRANDPFFNFSGLRVSIGASLRL